MPFLNNLFLIEQAILHRIANGMTDQREIVEDVSKRLQVPAWKVQSMITNLSLTIFDSESDLEQLRRLSGASRKKCKLALEYHGNIDAAYADLSKTTEYDLPLEVRVGMKRLKDELTSNSE